MMKCPSCGTNDVTRAAIEWEKHSRVHVVNTSTPNKKRVGGLTQNLSAFKLSPPDEPKGHAPLAILVGVVGVLFGVAAGQSLPVLGWIIFFGCAGYAVYLSMKDMDKRKAAYTLAKANWDKLWFCNRCGETASEDGFRPTDPTNPLIEGGDQPAIPAV